MDIFELIWCIVLDVCLSWAVLPIVHLFLSVWLFFDFLCCCCCCKFSIYLIVFEHVFFRCFCCVCVCSYQTNGWSIHTDFGRCDDYDDSDGDRNFIDFIFKFGSSHTVCAYTFQSYGCFDFSLNWRICRLNSVSLFLCFFFAVVRDRKNLIPHKIHRVEFSKNKNCLEPKITI